MKILSVKGLVCVASLLLVLLPGCVTSSRELSNKEIASRVEARFRNAAYLEDATVVFQTLIRKDGVLPGGAGPFDIRYKAAPGRLNAQLLSGTELKNEFSLFEGNFQERRPSSKTPLIEYPTPFPHGIETLQGHGPQDCFMGSYVYSWLGADNVPPSSLKVDRAVSMRRKVEDGERLPDIMERGHDCYMFRQTLMDVTIETDDRFIYETVYVDKATFLVVRWDTENVINGYLRIRLMDTKFFNEIPPGIQWQSKS